MIVWLVSYPRSGNTLTRTILRRCFKAATHSIYDEGSKGDLVRDMGVPAFCEMARASPEALFLKTHELPNDRNDPLTHPSDRIIYIARDGRAAMASHRHFLHDVGHQSFALEYIVAGAPPIVSWADHVTAWLDRPADRRLLLRFENLSRPDRGSLETIATFIGRPVLKEFDVNFADLHEKNPTYFRVGHDEPGIAEVERTCPALFWGVNGRAMTGLGYAPPASDHPLLAQDTIDEIRQAMRRVRSLAMRETTPNGRPRATTVATD